MIPLQGINLLSYKDNLKLNTDSKGATIVFDPLRRNYFPATPEEIVRQLWIIYFLDVALISKKLMAVERAFQSYRASRRFDLVIFDKTTMPVLLAEFKGPAVKIKQSTFDQIARYNMELHIPYSLVSNGIEHFCFQIDNELKRFVWKDQLPFSN